MQLVAKKPLPLWPIRTATPFCKVKQLELLVNAIGILLLEKFGIDPTLLIIKAPDSSWAFRL
jgi:hypothetical protein